MGWEQVVFPLTLINEYQGTIINFDYAEDSIRQQLNNETECTNFINQYIEGQYLDIQSIPSSETIIYEKDSYTITVRWANANTPNTPGIVINFKFPDGVNKITAMSDYSGYMSRMRYIKFGIAINEDTQRATCIIGGYCSYNNNYFCNIDGITFSVNVRDQYEQQLYEWIIPAKPDPQGATIKVNYYLPDYDYTYAKITYKQDSEPDSETDGKSVEILKDETSVNIEGLEEEKTYYFKIFTDKSESEAFPYTVEVDPVPPEYKTYIDNINGTGFDWIRELEQDIATITNSDRSTFTADMYKYYPMNKVTWYTYSHQGTDVEYWNKTTFEGQTTALFVSSKIDKVEINSNNNVYSCTITKNNENSVTSPDRMFVYEKTITMGGVYTKDTLPRGWYANFNYHSGYLAYGPNCNPFYLAGSWKNRTFSGTLTEVFEQLQRYVRNIDIYVDGVLWSKAGK